MNYCTCYALESRDRLPITISILCTLKTQLRRDTSFSLLEKYLFWAAFTLAFYGFLRSSEFATTELTWSDLQMHSNHYSLTIQQSKTDPFRRGHVLTLHESQTSTCPVKAMSHTVKSLTLNIRRKLLKLVLLGIHCGKKLLL